MPFSILHFSDLHLDTAFTASRLPASLARHCREQLRQTLRRIIDLAKERQAGAVTIAGDLFERTRISPETSSFLIREFERLAPIPVFIAPGKNDAADPKSIYQRGRWPENVNLLVSNRLTERALTKEISLWSAAHLSNAERQFFLQNFQPAKNLSERFHILLLHAQLVASANSPPQQQTPITLEEIRHAGFPLALLGQQHTSQVLQSDQMAVIYPGSPEPLGFDEAGSHGVAWIQLEPGQAPHVETIVLAQLRFETAEIAVDDCAHGDQLFDKIMALQRAQNLGSAFVRLRLIGNAQPALFLDLPLLTQHVQKHFAFIQIVNATRPALDLAQMAQEPTVRGAFVKEILADIDGELEEQPRYRDALIYGLQAFTQEDIALR